MATGELDVQDLQVELASLDRDIGGEFAGFQAAHCCSKGRIVADAGQVAPEIGRAIAPDLICFFASERLFRNRVIALKRDDHADADIVCGSRRIHQHVIAQNAFKLLDLRGEDKRLTASLIGITSHLSLAGPRAGRHQGIIVAQSAQLILQAVEGCLEIGKAATSQKYFCGHSVLLL